MGDIPDIVPTNGGATYELGEARVQQGKVVKGGDHRTPHRPEAGEARRMLGLQEF